MEAEETPDATADEQTPSGESEEEIARLMGELEDVRDLVRRKQAEFENYRKRVERERQDFISHASGDLVMEILPVLDNLERALEAPDAGGERLREGIEIVHRQFRDILERAGLREVEALGLDFDPHVHEAVGQVETVDYPEGEVLEVYQKGYFFKERLLRPALVNVAQRPQVPVENGSAGDGEDETSENEAIESDARQS